MAKRLECPNCGAPATEQSGKPQFTCGYCGSVADVTDNGLRKAGLGDLDPMLTALAASHVDAQLKADFQVGLRELDQHPREKSHESSPYRPGWLDALSGSSTMKFGCAPIIAGTAIAIAGIRSGSETVVSVGGAVFALGLVLTLLLAILSNVLHDYVEPAFPSLPNLAWHVRAVELVGRQQSLADRAGIPFQWPASVPRSTEEARSLVERAVEAAPAKAATWKKRVVLIVVVFAMVVAYVMLMASKLSSVKH